MSGHGVHHHPSGSPVSAAALSPRGGAGSVQPAEVSRKITGHSNGFFLFFLWAFGMIANALSVETHEKNKRTQGDYCSE